METASLGALRTYDLTKRALSPEKRLDTSSIAGGQDKTNLLAKGAEEFSKTFKRVEEVTGQMHAGTANAQSVVEALANAELALESAVTIRNRVVEAYQELLRMPV